MTLNITQNTRRAPVIGASQWSNILKLVGLMAVANGRFVQDDMEAFKDAMMELRAVVDPTLVMTRRMAQDWMVIHKDELTAVVDGLEYDSELIAIFKEIRNFPYKLDVVTAMMRVGIADGDHGHMEKMFLKKTILYWNIRSHERFDQAQKVPAPFIAITA